MFATQAGCFVIRFVVVGQPSREKERERERDGARGRMRLGRHSVYENNKYHALVCSGGHGSGIELKRRVRPMLHCWSHYFHGGRIVEYFI